MTSRRNQTVAAASLPVHSGAKKISPEEYSGELRALMKNFEDVTRRLKSESTRGTAILGLGVLTHDTSAALINSKSGEVLYALSEERLSNIKHDSRFPLGAMVNCLKTAQECNLSIEAVAINVNPIEFLTGTLSNELDKIIDNVEIRNEILDNLINYGKYLEPFNIKKENRMSECIKTIFSDSRIKSDHYRNIIRKISWYFNCYIKYRRVELIIRNIFPELPVTCINHHEAHAASCYLESGFTDATVIVIDGHGECDTTTIWKGEQGQIARLSSSIWPNSIGSLYLLATRHLGFDHGDEYKVMGMSAYGRPKFIKIFKDILKLRETGVIELSEGKYFCKKDISNTGHERGHFSAELEHVVPKRNAGDPIGQVHFDFAASVQSVVEKIGAGVAAKGIKLTGSGQVALSGGVALNGLMNNCIRQLPACDDIFIYPAASDDGTSVGAAQALFLRRGQRKNNQNRLRSVFFGSGNEEQCIINALDRLKVNYEKVSDINRKIAQALADGEIVGRSTGRSEFGPRALGHRSLLANPTIKDMKNILNSRVKNREEFRPFAPACLEEHVKDFFEIDVEAPFMLLIPKAKLGVVDLIPAVVHADRSARVQTVSKEHNPDFYRTIEEFYKLTDIPVVINTSFNVNGEAIVETPLDALESFAYMDIDFLALEDYWIPKKGNEHILPEMGADQYLNRRVMRYYEEFQSDLRDVDVRAYGEWFYFTDSELNTYISNNFDRSY